MTKILAAAMVMLSVGRAHANPLTDKHAAIPIAVEALLLLDYAQTMQGMGRGNTEHNVILGPHPSKAGVSAYFLCAAGSYAAAYALLPGWAGNAISGGLILVEVPVIGLNFHAGYRFRF